MTEPPDGIPQQGRGAPSRGRAATALAAAAALVLTSSLQAQVTRAGFVPQPPPGERPVIYAQHAFMPGSDVSTLRLDVWGERWGAAVGGGFIHPDGGQGSGGTLDLALMRAVRPQKIEAETFGIQAQLGASVGRRDGGWTWEAPLTAGGLVSIPVGTPIGFLQGHLWGDVGVRVRGGDDEATVGGVGAGVGLRVLGHTGAVRGMGAQLRGGLLRIDGATEGSVELGVNIVLLSRR